MKNYKHVSKSNNAMKLAAVASAAVMLAPVAMSSVSSFAAGMTGTGVYYPANNVVSVASAYNAGTDLQITAPYLFASKTDIMKQIDAVLAVKSPVTPAANIETSYSFTNPTYTPIYTATNKPVASARDLANTATDQVFNSKKQNTPAVYNQLNEEQQSEYGTSKANVNAQYKTLNSNYGQLKKQTAADAQKAENTKLRFYMAEKGFVLSHGKGLPDAADRLYIESDFTKGKVTVQDLANMKSDWDAKDTKFREDIQSLQATAKTFSDYMDAVISVGEKMAPLTNNGSVNKAAMLAAQAIYAMPAGADRDAATKEFNTLVGDYRAITVAKNAATVGDRQAMDAAADKTANALLTLADNKTDLQAGKQIGVATVNYNPNYGIQIWDKSGRIVRFDAKDAAAWNALYPNNKVKVGDAKKLAGQTSWKIFKNTYKANGTTYYNLGGDQYIDAAYVTVK